MSDIARLHIENHEALGKLIKTWALGEDRVKNGGVYLPKPDKDLAAFTRMLVASKATSQAHVDTWLDSFQGTLSTVEFVQSSEQTLVMRLPMARMVKEMEAALAAGARYPLPDFYRETFFADAPQKVADPARAHHQRIGDYTIAQCG